MSPNLKRDRASELEDLTLEQFSEELTEAEIRLVRAAALGRPVFCGPSEKEDDPTNDPGGAEGWGANREIRGELIRWLCVDRSARELIDPKGIYVVGARVRGPIDLENVVVLFSLSLCRCLVIEDLTLLDAQIPLLDLQGSRVGNIFADRVIVKGSVFFRGARTEGEVHFRGAQIGATFDCGGATFENPGRDKDVGEKGYALNLNRAVVKGSVFLRKGFGAKGTVWLADSEIGSFLDCTGAKIMGTLSVGGAVIKGAFHWEKIVDPEHTDLVLKNAAAGVFRDDKASWPGVGKLDLDGFVYRSIAPKDVQTRLDWLDRQKQPFKAQTYRQFAKFLRDKGGDADARRVLFEMERRRRAQEDRWIGRLWGWILRAAIGYGYYPERAIRWLSVLAVLGWFLFCGGYFTGNVAPTDKDAYTYFKNDGRPPAYYGRFHALAYSVENSFPFVKLGQAERWQPDPSPRGAESQDRRWGIRMTRAATSAGFLRLASWCQIILGWILATLFAAGVTGVVRRD